MTKLTIATAEAIALEIAKEVDEHPCPTKEWKEFSEQALWNELVACILGSQVSFEHANSAVRHLCSSGLLNIRSLVEEPNGVERKISEELSKPLYAPLRRNGLGRKYRYPNAKARQITQTAITLYSNGYSLFKLLHESESDIDARSRMMNICVGIGPKQASLFLRNIGYTSQLAIIDSQVLKFMRKKGLATKNTGYIRNRSEYFGLEKIFVQYAREVNLNPGDLDMAIWTVMRMVSVGET